MEGAQLATGVQQLESDHGAAQGHGCAQHAGGSYIQTEQLADGEAEDDGEHYLHQPAHDGHPSHVRHLGEGELDPQSEEEQGDAKLGDALYAVDIDIPHGDVVADDKAGHQVAQDDRQPQETRQHATGGGGRDDDDQIEDELLLVRHGGLLPSRPTIPYSERRLALAVATRVDVGS